MMPRTPSSNRYRALAVCALTLTLAAGCVSTGPDAALATRLADPARSEADRNRDTTSLPAEVIAFAGVNRGDVVLDLFAGGGYYSELLAAAVGPGGRVLAHNNAAYLGFAAPSLEARLANLNLPQLARYDRELSAIDLPEGSVDVVMLVLSYHDTYFVSEGWDVRAEPLLRAVRRVLKPNGRFVVIDHHARAGTANSDAQYLHRLDVRFAIADIEARGFTLEERSTLLENTTDNLAKSVFDPEVRGRTSRFLLRFATVGQGE